MKYSLALFSVILLVACNGADNIPDVDKDLVPKQTPSIPYNIVNIYPHDTSSFTQGLQLYNGKLYEGTGDYTNSALQIVDIKTGKIVKKHMMGTNKIFGEGITIFKEKIYQLTWQSNIVYVYALNNMDKPIKTFNWPYEGWGLTNNGSELILSDGSANLYFIDAETFKIKSTIAVTEDAKPINSLNELEYVDGFVYANVWGAEFIVKIDPASGHVVGKINLAGIKEKYFANEITEYTDVLNGIAYDSTTKKFFITGKHWPKMFEITLN